MKMKVVITGNAHGDPKARFDITVQGDRDTIDKGIGVVTDYLDLFDDSDLEPHG